MVGQLVWPMGDRSVGWEVGWMGRCLVGRRVRIWVGGWSVGLPVGCVDCRLVMWVIGWLGGLLVG